MLTFAAGSSGTAWSWEWTNTSNLSGAFEVHSLLEASDGYIYAGTWPNGDVFRTNDGGATWANTSNLSGAFYVYSLLEASDGYIYAGTGISGDVFRTNDGGATWTNTSDLTGATFGIPLLEASDGYIYAGTSPNGDVFRTDDGGVTWTNTLELSGAGTVISLLEASDGHIYAGTGSNNGDVFKTSDPILCLDRDQDLYSTEGEECGEVDCDDSNESVYPGATEVCDGIDNNCNDNIDEEPAASDSCDNGTYCDGEEYCSGGSCHSNPAPDCSGLNDECNLGVCDEAEDQCVAEHVAGNCDDGTYCNGDDACQEQPDGSGLYVNVGPGVDCSGLDDECNVGVCDEADDQCVALPANEGGPCKDGNACTIDDTCSGGDCISGPELDCDDGIGCTDDSCDEVNDTCVNSPNDVNCDDGQWCNGAETCHAALDCQSATAPVCDDGVSCTDDSCDEEIGDCAFSCNAAGPDDPCCQDAACSDTPVCTLTHSIPTFNCAGIIVLLSLFVTVGLLTNLRRSRSV